jgi:hypothetical protein
VVPSQALPHEWKDIEYLLRMERALSKIKVPFSHIWQKWSWSWKRNDINLIQITLRTNFSFHRLWKLYSYFRWVLIYFCFPHSKCPHMALCTKCRGQSVLLFSFSTWSSLSICSLCVFLKCLKNDHGWCFLNKLNPFIPALLCIEVTATIKRKVLKHTYYFSLK